MCVHAVFLVHCMLTGVSSLIRPHVILPSSSSFSDQEPPYSMMTLHEMAETGIPNALMPHSSCRLLGSHLALKRSLKVLLHAFFLGLEAIYSPYLNNTAPQQ